MSQLSIPEYLDLMRKYHIEFEGRITPNKWGKYATIFNDVRSIGSITWKEFENLHRHREDLYFQHKVVAKSELVEGAWKSLNRFDSEMGWRSSVESKALERFDSEITW